jgi:cyclophilin family peptidyl-prolyl cis-trans isomerase
MVGVYRLFSMVAVVSSIVSGFSIRSINLRQSLVKDRHKRLSVKLHDKSGEVHDGYLRRCEQALQSTDYAVDLVTNRKTVLRFGGAAIMALVARPASSNAAVDVSGLPRATSSPSDLQPRTLSSSFTVIRPEDAPVTDTVYFDVRISRQDGTFYVNDDLPDIPENRVFMGRIIVDLFGATAPNYVARFLSYIDPDYIPGSKKPASSSAVDMDENPLPLYSRATFRRLDQDTGLLVGGCIAGLRFSEINGSPALQYNGRLLPARLWLEGQRQQSPSTATSVISHTAKGLLTHRILDVTPEFGITTRSDTPELDGTHVVFGKVRLTDKSSGNDGAAFLDLVRDLPTYGMDRPSTMVASSSDNADGAAMVVDDATSALFNAQRQFFRSAAKSIGDTRIDKVYEGKLLRRVEVTRAGIVF